MKNSAIGSNWKDVKQSSSPREGRKILGERSDLRVAIMTELIEARHEKNRGKRN